MFFNKKIIRMCTLLEHHFKKIIAQMEKEYDIKVLYACESGSRAWGFSSQESDYDVRFIYIHHPSWYLSIDRKRDVIEIPKRDSLSIPVDPLLDISGWELTKALKLFRKSNPPLLEWLHSNMIYYQRFSTIEKMRNLEKEVFSPTSTIYHYINMAKGNFREYLQGDIVKIKKYFYVLRPVLAAKWVQSFETIPPMEFNTLVQMLIPMGALRIKIESLVERKKSGQKLAFEPRINLINEFLDTEINLLETYAKGLEKNLLDPTERLNDLFRNTLNEAWENN